MRWLILFYRIKGIYLVFIHGGNLIAKFHANFGYIALFWSVECVNLSGTSICHVSRICANFDDFFFLKIILKIFRTRKNIGKPHHLWDTRCLCNIIVTKIVSRFYFTYDDTRTIKTICNKRYINQNGKWDIFFFL